VGREEVKMKIESIILSVVVFGLVADIYIYLSMKRWAYEKLGIKIAQKVIDKKGVIFKADGPVKDLEIKKYGKVYYFQNKFSKLPFEFRGVIHVEDDAYRVLYVVNGFCYFIITLFSVFMIAVGFNSKVCDSVLMGALFILASVAYSLREKKLFGEAVGRLFVNK